jgi:hypothetical protein
MKVQINFKLINPDYDQDYANDYNEGEESESNMKYDWATTYEVKEASSVELIENGTFQLKGKFKDKSEFDYTIPNVSIFRCHLEKGHDLDFAVSKSVMRNTHQTHIEKYKTTRCYFYIYSEPKSIAITDNLVLAVNEIPEELKIIG